MTGFRRIHHHLSHMVALGLCGQTVESMAYAVQLLRAIRKSCLGAGSWEHSSLMVPSEDSCTKSSFATAEEELEAILGYQDAMKKLRKGGVDHDDDVEKDPPPQGSGNKHKQ